MGETINLKLYVTGMSVTARKAVENIQKICQDELEGDCNLEVIDIAEHPQLAEDERILATPLLIKEVPPPLRRLIGDLSDKEKVLLGLDVRREKK